MQTDIELQADLFEDMQIFVYSPAYQEEPPPKDPCPTCAGTGISHTFTESVEDIFGTFYQDHFEVPCADCAGTGQLKKEAA
jgi:DnaJ-class molecular chaperone